MLLDRYNGNDSIYVKKIEQLDVNWNVQMMSSYDVIEVQ